MKQRSITIEEMDTAIDLFVQTPRFKEIDMVLGVANGGTVLAEIFAKKLGVPLVMAEYSSKKGKGDGNHRQILPTRRYKKLLIVDDIVDTGHTIKEISEFYKRKNCIVSSYVLYFNIDNEAGVDAFYHVPLSEDNKPWIVFPWEDEWDEFEQQAVNS